MNMEKIRAIVIDDEYLNRDLITKFIQSLDPNYDIIANASDIDSAFELINFHRPDLIFLDIKMPGGNGFELLERFDKPFFEVVFITGFDEYAIKAFEHNAVDYILKPIDADKLKQMLQKVYERIAAKLSVSTYLKEIISAYNVDYSK